MEELRYGQGPLIAQVLRDYTDHLHSKAGEQVISNSMIPLPFPLKLNFQEVIKFDGSDATTCVSRPFSRGSLHLKIVKWYETSSFTTATSRSNQRMMVVIAILFRHHREKKIKQ